MDAGSRELARLWIKANVLSAAADTAGYAVIVLVNRTLWVSDPDFGALFATGFLSFAGTIKAVTTAVFGYLTGHVFAHRFPAFPVRTWVAVNTVFGLLYGPFMYADLVLAKPDEPATWTAELVVAMAVLGISVNALVGCVQAWVLRQTAHGMGTWIGFSALSGLCWLLSVVAMVYVPGGIPGDVAGAVANFVAFVVSGLIQVPAVLRLRPRGGHDIPTLFE